MRVPLAIDPLSLQRQFDRRADGFESADFVLREIEMRMLERLDLIRLAPAGLVDIGCGTGNGLQLLQQRYPAAQIHGIDQSPAMVRAAARRLAPSPPIGLGGVQGLGRALKAAIASAMSKAPAASPAASLLVGSADNLPLPDSSVDLVWSNLAFHWFADPVAALAQCRRVLRAQGLLMMSSFGVDTGEQLRAHGASLPTFQDMHDIGDALVNAGFAEPVLDMEKLTYTYTDADTLLKDARALGGNPLRDRLRGLHTPRQRRLWLQQLADTRTLTVEVIYVHAWLPARAKLPEGYAPIEFVKSHERS